MVAPRDVRIDSKFFTPHLAEYVILDGTTFSGTETIDLLTAEPENPVSNVIITGAIPAGVTVEVTNQPDGTVVNLVFTAPGTETVLFSDPTIWLTPTPVHEAGKGAFYQIKKFGATILGFGNIEGGTTVAAGGSIWDAWAVLGGAEIALGGAPTGAAGAAETWYQKAYEGNMDESQLGTILGGIDSGAVDKYKLRLVTVDPQNGQRYNAPYGHDDSNAYGIAIQWNVTEFRMILGTAFRVAAYDYRAWVDYTKV